MEKKLEEYVSEINSIETVAKMLIKKIKIMANDNYINEINPEVFFNLRGSRPPIEKNLVYSSNSSEINSFMRVLYYLAEARDNLLEKYSSEIKKTGNN